MTTVTAPAEATTPAQAQTHGEVDALARRLRLPYLRRTATDILATARSQRWDPAEVIRVLLDAEATGRDAATITARRKRAGLPSGKTFDSWDPACSTIPAASQNALRTLEWVARHENLCLAGPSGTGKSHFLEAPGHHAIDQGLTRQRRRRRGVLPAHRRRLRTTIPRDLEQHPPRRVRRAHAHHPGHRRRRPAAAPRPRHPHPG
jgi:hypothetical protein